jgi:hypothetical protein
MDLINTLSSLCFGLTVAALLEHPFQTSSRELQTMRVHFPDVA